MKIEIKLDADEVAEFAQLPDRLRNISLMVQGLQDRIFSIQQRLEVMQAKTDQAIKNHIGG